MKESTPKIFDRDEYAVKTYKILERLLFNKNVLNTDEGKAEIYRAIDGYIERLEDAIRGRDKRMIRILAFPPRIASKIYTDFILKEKKSGQIKLSVGGGMSLLWNAVNGAYPAFAAFPLCLLAGLLTVFYVCACSLAFLAVMLAPLLFIAAGLLYTATGLAGFFVNFGTGAVYFGIGCFCAGVLLLAHKFIFNFVRNIGNYISSPLYSAAVLVKRREGRVGM
jgi:uncharacterized membrane protein